MSKECELKTVWMWCSRQVGRGPGQPGLVLNVEVGGPACDGGGGGRGRLEIHGPRGPFQPGPFCDCDSVILERP